MNTNTCEYNSHGNVPFVSAFVSSRVVSDVWMCVSMQKKQQNIVYPQLAYGNGAYFCYCCCPYVCTVCHHLTYGFEWMGECMYECVCVFMLCLVYDVIVIIPYPHIHPYSLCTSLTWTLVSMNDVLFLVFVLFFFLVIIAVYQVGFVVCAFSFEFCTQNVYSSVCLSVRLSGGVLNLKNIFIAAFIHFAVYPPLLLLYAAIFVVVLFIHTLLLLVSFYFVPLLLFPLFVSKFSLNA